MEVYEDSDALLAYYERPSEAGETGYPYDTTKVEVCGNVSAALRERLDAGKSPIEFFHHLGGFTR